MNATIQDFHDFIKPSVHGCPTNILDSAIRASVNEFLEKTLLWNQEIFYGNLVEDQRYYAVNYLGSDVSVVAPLNVMLKWYDDTGELQHKELIPCSLFELERRDPKWVDLSAEEPTRYYMEEPNSISLVEKPTEDSAKSIFVTCAVKPSRNSDEMPDFLLNEWAEGIAHGALCRLHAIAGRVWANINMVSYHNKKFKEAISRAKSKMYKSYSISSKTMSPKTF